MHYCGKPETDERKIIPGNFVPPIDIPADSRRGMAVFAAGRIERALCCMNLDYIYEKDSGTMLSRLGMSELLRRRYPKIEDNGAFHPIWNNIIKFTDEVVCGAKRLEDAAENEDVLSLLGHILEQREQRGLQHEAGMEPTAMGLAQMCRILFCGLQDFACDTDGTLAEYENDTTGELVEEDNDSQATVDYVPSSQGSANVRDSESTIDYTGRDPRRFTDDSDDSCDSDCDRDHSPELCPLPNSMETDTVDGDDEAGLVPENSGDTASDGSNTIDITESADDNDKQRDTASEADTIDISNSQDEEGTGGVGEAVGGTAQDEEVRQVPIKRSDESGQYDLRTPLKKRRYME